MERRPATPRPDFRERVAAQGLVYATTRGPDGDKPYWIEDAYYTFSAEEIDVLEAATERLHGMAVEAARFLATGAMGNLGLPPGALRLAGESLAAGAPSLYGRFDLRYDGTAPPTLLEYNADTPTGLLEAAVVQWYWLEDTHPDADQWNSLHERLILAWRKLAPTLPWGPVYFAHHADEPTGEEEMTVTYLRDTADQAGLDTAGITIGEIGWDAQRRAFTDLAERPMRTIFKLYPWEDMLAEEFGAHVEPVPRGDYSPTWLEPPWKVLLSNKALLAALWHLYPGDELLVPAYLDRPGGLTEWVAKPLHGREGANVRIHADGIDEQTGGAYGSEGFVFQQWAPLPDYGGNKPVLGTWIVDGLAAGLGIRESDGWITDDRSRFVPHLITAERPSDAVRQAWLADAGADVQDALPGAAPAAGQAPPLLTLGGPDGDVQDQPRTDPRSAR